MVLIGRTSTDDAESCGCPNSAVNCSRKHKNKMVLADRKLKLREIADTLKISEGSLFTILHEHLSMRTWIHHYTPELNRQSAMWTAKGENRLKRPKTCLQT